MTTSIWAPGKTLKALRSATLGLGAIGLSLALAGSSVAQASVSNDEMGGVGSHVHKTASVNEIVLPEGQDATIKGRVTGPDGRPVKSVKVSLHPDATPDVSTMTDDQGAYALTWKMRPETYVRLIFDPPSATGLVPALYGHSWQSDVNNQWGELINIRPGQTVESIDQRLETGQVITGRVSGSDGSTPHTGPVEFHTVQRENPAVRRTAVPDASGNFTSPVLPLGSYTAWIQPTPGSKLGEVQTPYRRAGEIEPTLITLGAEAVPSVNWSLDRGSSMRGRVVDRATGNPVPGITVRNGGCEDPGSRDVRTDKDGYYTFPNLETGKYTLHFRDADLGRYAPMSYSAWTGTTGEGVAVRPNEVTTVEDVRIELAPVVRGKLKIKGGVVPKSWYVSTREGWCCDTYAPKVTFTQSGEFVMTGIETGEHILYAGASTEEKDGAKPKYYESIYLDATDTSEASRVSFAGGKTYQLEEWEVFLRSGLQLSVTTPDWKPISGSLVEIYDDRGILVGRHDQQASSSWVSRFFRVPNGSYRIFVRSRDAKFASQWSGGGNSLETAIPVVVHDGVTDHKMVLASTSKP